MIQNDARFLLRLRFRNVAVNTHTHTQNGLQAVDDNNNNNNNYSIITTHIYAPAAYNSKLYNDDDGNDSADNKYNICAKDRSFVFWSLQPVRAMTIKT